MASRQQIREQREEWLTSAASFGYWCDRYVQVYDATARTWLPFHLWPAQREVASVLETQRLVVILKARQLGMTWLVVGYALWLLLFRPAATVLLFSKRDDEAVQLLGFRLSGMYHRLPAWMQAREIVTNNDHELRLSNGSAALAFPTTGGRSYTATLAVVDEADHVGGGSIGDDLDNLLDAVKPTIDGGGSLVLLSTVNKDRPASAFKRIYRAANANAGGGIAANVGAWTRVFLPWSAHPARTPEWYAAQVRDVQSRTGALDSLYQEYPASDVEALAGRSRDRRFAPEWLARADDTRAPIVNGEFDVTIGRRGEASGGETLTAAQNPRPDASPSLGGETLPDGCATGSSPSLARGETSMEPRDSLPAPSGDGCGTGGPACPPTDDATDASTPSTSSTASTNVSAADASTNASPAGAPALPGLAVFDPPAGGRDYVIGADPAEGNPQSDESVACVIDAITGDQVAVLAGQCEPAVFAAYLAELMTWYGAGALVERNNHGHAVLLWMADNGLPGVLRGRDGKPGWLSSAKGKVLAYDAAAELLRDGSPSIRDTETLRQLMEIRGATLQAGQGDHDDRATAWVLAVTAARYSGGTASAQGEVLPPRPVVTSEETNGW